MYGGFCPQEMLREKYFMADNSAISQFAAAFAEGNIRIVDLSVTLNEETPVLQLPEQFGQGWPFRKEEISHYDERGPAWYHNNFSCCEHTGTHFDAPIHWVTGKDYDHHATDTIKPEHFIAPACVIDCSGYVAEDEDFLIRPSHIEAWEQQYGRIPAKNWVLFHSGWSGRTREDFLNMREDAAP